MSDLLDLIIALGALYLALKALASGPPKDVIAYVLGAILGLFMIFIVFTIAAENFTAACMESARFASVAPDLCTFLEMLEASP